MTYYQIKAKGRRATTEETWIIFSKWIYKTQKEAEAHIEQFKIKVITPNDKYDMHYLQKENLEMSIHELWVHDVMGDVGGG